MLEVPKERQKTQGGDIIGDKEIHRSVDQTKPAKAKEVLRSASKITRSRTVMARKKVIEMAGRSLMPLAPWFA